jgi:FAD:protein FMN transferase
MVALPGRSWNISLPAARQVALQGRALATSSPLGMTFGGDGRSSHILDPRTGHPVVPRWSAVSISAPRAALADALSTAACLAKDRADIAAMCNAFAGAVVESAVFA